MITEELILDVFARMNEWAEGNLVDNMVALGMIEDTEEDRRLMGSTIFSLVESQSDMMILGTPVADPLMAAAKAFLAGVLVGRLEFTTKED